jgi:pullulanase
MFIPSVLSRCTISLSLLSPILVDAAPNSVALVGSLQEELGCSSDWQPECAITELNFTDEYNWTGTFNIAPGDWEYKIAYNDNWDENYGAGGAPGGDNIQLSLSEQTAVKFYYDHTTHWITDNISADIVTAVGNFQTQLGCPGDWQPECLRSWLQDPDGNGVYTFITNDLLAGDYEVKATHDESWDENYGAGGAPGGANIAFSVAANNDSIAFSYNADTHILTVGDSAAEGNLRLAKAYWLGKDTIVWDVPTDASVQLHYDADGELTSSPAGVSGGQAELLIYHADGLDAQLQDRFPHLANLPVFKISHADDLALVPQILKQQFVVSALNNEGSLIDATALQPAGVLDDLYGSAINNSDDHAFGVSFEGGTPTQTPTLRLWAPTAQSVSLHLFNNSGSDRSAVEYAMTEDANTGIWTITGEAHWNRKFYLFEVNVFVRSTGQVENNLVTDPYSVSAGINGMRSQIVNLKENDLKPDNWETLNKPTLESPEDISIYELHVRDFSISDKTVAKNLRGTFMAFTQNQSDGMAHLRKLASAGLTHIHLLPSFDCATIDEDPNNRETIDQDLSVYGPDSEQQQTAVAAIKANDGFNWCYDPFHYTLPEGSYATEADGITRIREFREMVAALNDAGLRVVMDVVYNHTSGSLQGEKSVLDKIVPDYYHRLNSEGFIENSSCCSNTATEHAMMEKLMLDSLKVWATEYKVDGFRFDLMAHHSKDNIVKARDQLQALTPEKHGVNGKTIYLYGEGWNFGEVANNARFVQASQANMAGTGVGSFNDRFRDALRGGGPFDRGIDHIRNQGLISGLYYDPNAENTGNDTEREKLLHSADYIRLALAGSLAQFSFINRNGDTVSGADIDYAGQPAGYTGDPQETINYAAAHDNETLFDINQYKAPLQTSASDRVRIQNMANSFIALAQGIPFFHAGQDLLRSKSLDHNSYDSGDWFNRLDLGYNNNGWAGGLPMARDNEDGWTISGPLLANPALAINRDNILRAGEHFQEMLTIRKSSPLFRLQSAAQIRARLTFHNTGAGQLPGLIAMRLNDQVGEDLDPLYEQIVVLFNANDKPQSLTIATMADSHFNLHKTQLSSSDARLQEARFDSATGEFSVPARTTAVFVKPERVDGKGNGGGGGAFFDLFWLLFLVTAVTLGFRLRKSR